MCCPWKGKERKEAQIIHRGYNFHFSSMTPGAHLSPRSTPHPLGGTRRLERAPPPRAPRGPGSPPAAPGTRGARNSARAGARALGSPGAPLNPRAGSGGEGRRRRRRCKLGPPPGCAILRCVCGWPRDQTLGRELQEGGSAGKIGSDAWRAALQIWAPFDSHFHFLPFPPWGTLSRPGGARAAAGAGCPVRGPRNKELRAGRTCGGGGCQVPELPIDPRPGRGRAAPGSARPRAARATASGGAGRGGRPPRAWCGAGGRGARGAGGRAALASRGGECARGRVCERAGGAAPARSLPLVQLRHGFQGSCNPIPSDSQALSDSSDLVHPREGGEGERKRALPVFPSWHPIDFLEEGPIPARTPPRGGRAPRPDPRSLRYSRAGKVVPRLWASLPRAPSCPLLLLFLLLLPALLLPQVLTDVAGLLSPPSSLFPRPRPRPVSFLSATLRRGEDAPSSRTPAAAGGEVGKTWSAARLTFAFLLLPGRAGGPRFPLAGSPRPGAGPSCDAGGGEEAARRGPGSGAGGSPGAPSHARAPSPPSASLPPPPPPPPPPLPGPHTDTFMPAPPLPPP